MTLGAKALMQDSEMKVLVGDMPLCSYGNLSNSFDLPRYDILIWTTST